MHIAHHTADRDLARFPGNGIVVMMVRRTKLLQRIGPVTFDDQAVNRIAKVLLIILIDGRYRCCNLCGCLLRKSQHRRNRKGRMLQDIGHLFRLAPIHAHDIVGLEAQVFDKLRMLAPCENRVHAVARIRPLLFLLRLKLRIHLCKSGKIHIDFATDRIFRGIRHIPRMAGEPREDIALIATTARHVHRLAIVRIDNNAAAIEFWLDGDGLEFFQIRQQFIRLRLIDFR